MCELDKNTNKCFARKVTTSYIYIPQKVCFLCYLECCIACETIFLISFPGIGTELRQPFVKFP